MRLPLIVLVAAFGAMLVSEAGSQSPHALYVDAVVDREAALLACGLDAIWAVSGGQLIRIDPEGNRIVEIEIPKNDIAASLTDMDRFRGIAVGEGAVWLPDTASSTIYKIDPGNNRIALKIATDIFGSRGSIGVGEGAIWVITFDSRDKTLTRYSAATGAVEARIALPTASNGVMVAFGSIWVTATDTAALYQIDPKRNEVARTIVTRNPSHLMTAGYGAVWLSIEVDGLVQKIDGESGKTLATIATNIHDSVSDGEITAGDGYVWTMNRWSTVARVDPTNNSVTGIYQPPPGTPMGRRLCHGAEALWVSGSSIFRVKPPVR